MKQGKCIIIIDGSNFYFKLKDLRLHHLIDFDFASFAKWLAGKDKIRHVTYYVAMVANCSKSRLLTKEELSPFIRLTK